MFFFCLSYCWVPAVLKALASNLRLSRHNSSCVRHSRYDGWPAGIEIQQTATYGGETLQKKVREVIKFNYTHFKTKCKYTLSALNMNGGNSILIVLTSNTIKLFTSTTIWNLKNVCVYIYIYLYTHPACQMQLFILADPHEYC